MEKIVELHKKTLEKYLLNKKKLITLLLFEHNASPKKNLQFVKIVRGRPKITYAVGTHGRDNANYEQIYNHLRTVLEGINPIIAFVNSTSLGDFSASGDFLEKKKTIDTYFGKLKLDYDEQFDLLTYNKITRQFTATQNFNDKIPAIISSRAEFGGGDYNSGKKNSQSGGSSFIDYIFVGAPEVVLGDDIFSRDTYEWGEYFTPLLRNFNESIIHTDHHITLESAFLIHLIKCQFHAVTKDIFSVLYDYFKRQIQKTQIKNPKFFIYIHSFIFDESIGINSESLVNFIIYTGQDIADKMGLYTQDFFHKDDMEMINSMPMEAAEILAAPAESESANAARLQEAARLAEEAAEESMVIARAADAKILAAKRLAAAEAEQLAAEAARLEAAAAEAVRLEPEPNPRVLKRRLNPASDAFMPNEQTPEPPEPLKLEKMPRAPKRLRVSGFAGGARKTKRKRRRNRKDKKKKKTQTRNRNNSRAKSSKKRTVKVSKRKSKTQHPKASE